MKVFLFQPCLGRQEKTHNMASFKNKTLEIGAGTLNHLKYEIKKHYPDPLL